MAAPSHDSTRLDSPSVRGIELTPGSPHRAAELHDVSSKRGLLGLLLMALLVGVVRLVEEWMLSKHALLNAPAGVALHLGFYWATGFVFLAVLALATGRRALSHLPIVILGIAAGVVPPLIDIAVSDINSFRYSYLIDISRDFRWHFYNPRAAVPLGEAITLWGVILGLTGYVWHTTRVWWRALAGGALAYAALVLTFVFFHAGLAALAKHQTLSLGSSSVLRGAARDHLRLPRGDLGLRGVDHPWVVSLLALGSFVYSCEPYRAKRRLPYSLMIEGLWGAAAITCGIVASVEDTFGAAPSLSERPTGQAVLQLLRADDAFRTSTMAVIPAAFVGWFLVSAHKDYKDVVADEQAGVQTLYTWGRAQNWSEATVHRWVTVVTVSCIFSMGLLVMLNGYRGVLPAVISAVAAVLGFFCSRLRHRARAFQWLLLLLTAELSLLTVVNALQ